jgi:hypothetical protein
VAATFTPTTTQAPADGPDAPLAVLNPRRASAMGLALLLGATPAIVLRQSVPGAAALHERAGELGWLGAAAAPILWLAAPLAILGALLLVMSPGLLLAAAFDRAQTMEDWVLHGFALTVPVVSVAAGVAQAIAGAPLRAAGFTAVVLACAAAAGVLLAVRVRRGARLRWPLAGPHGWATLSGMMLAPLLLLIALGPKFYWEAFNGDGAHAFEASRLLLHQAVPFWDRAAGEIAGYPGITSFLFAYPASWFIRLFGELEVSARLPLLLFLPPLAAGLMALINHALPRPIGVAERWLVWLAIAIYTVVVAFSATYSPYSADIALPATQDTLLVAAFLGFVLSFLRKAWGWAALFALFTYVSLPNGLLLLGFWIVAWFLVTTPRPWRESIISGGIVLGCMVLAGLAPRALSALGAPPPGGEYGAAAILVRFAYLQVTDWTRLAYVVVPCGIVPALALIAWRRQDRTARAMTLTTIAYFLFAFVQLRASLHYYIPAMLLPLVVYWRMTPRDGSARVLTLAATAVAALVALFISIPPEPGPQLASRIVGASFENRIEGYERSGSEQFRASTLMRSIIPYDWEPEVPESALGGSPLVFNHYGHRADVRAERNYVLQSAAEPAPAGTIRVAEEGGFAIYVRDTTVWRSHLALRPDTPAGAPIYQQQRGILFSSEPLVGGPRVIDLPAIAERMGVDVDALATRLGVER